MSISMTTQSSFTLEQAAELLGTTPMNILMHLKHQLIKGSDVDGQWSIDAESLHDFKHQNRGKDKTLCKKHNCHHSAGGCCE